MKRLFVFLKLLCATSLVTAQTVYLDALTAPALIGFSNTIKSQQERTNDNLSNIRNVQAGIAATLAAANDLQSKIYKGLSEVSGTVTNALTIKDIANTTADIVSALNETMQVAAQHPEFTIFATKAVNEFRLRSIALSGEVAQIITQNPTNLMYAGERQLLLNDLYSQVRLLYANAYVIKHSIEWAVRQGFFKSLSPFANYVNQDRQIMQDIMRNITLFDR